MNLIKTFLMLINREIPTEMLVKCGMKVGKDFNRQQGCFIDPSHCFLISIGDDVTMSIRVTVMAHDASTKKTLGYTKIGQVHIGNHVFVGANATILPGVTIGDYAVIGAGSVVTHDVPPKTVAAGCPARVIYSLDDYLSKCQEQLLQENTFNASYRMDFRTRLDEKQKAEIFAATDGRIGFIE